MYGDRFGGYGQEAPVKVGERYTVKIESLGKGGDGIAKIKGSSYSSRTPRSETRLRSLSTQSRGSSLSPQSSSD